MVNMSKAQGAIESSSCSTAGTLLGQGATEYLVLLAVVLIVALVSVALLGFFPGMASDAQFTQSQAYWQSASPIQVLESGARFQSSGGGQTRLYLRLRNAGVYPVRITKIYGADGGAATTFWANGGDPCGVPSGNGLFSTYIYIAPGAEMALGNPAQFPGLVCYWELNAYPGASGWSFIGGASPDCANSSASPGILVYKTIAFEYIEYVEGQQITKKQTGAKPLMIKCREPY